MMVAAWVDILDELTKFFRVHFHLQHYGFSRLQIDHENSQVLTQVLRVDVGFLAGMAVPALHHGAPAGIHGGSDKFIEPWIRGGVDEFVGFVNSARPVLYSRQMRATLTSTHHT